ncbi:MAG: MBL fold metallo-hydrolase [Anaerolineae bacterium]|nr:MBL fold metallo-hydrolase [Anaerolineae bacterium]
MEIAWYGHSCFRIGERGRFAVTDPYPPELGLELPRLSTNLVTVSHAHDNHSYVRALRGSPYVISGPGEYEVGGIFVLGVATYHDAKEGKELGKNTAYLIEIDDLTVCHLGDLGHLPSQEQLEQLNDVDVLLVPVGGRTALTGAKAAEVVNLIEPRIVIPMHYRIRGSNAKLDGPQRFFKELAVDAPEPMDMLKFDMSELPDTTRVVLLSLAQ